MNRASPASDMGFACRRLGPGPGRQRVSSIVGLQGGFVGRSSDSTLHPGAEALERKMPAAEQAGPGPFLGDEAGRAVLGEGQLRAVGNGLQGELEVAVVAGCV